MGTHHRRPDGSTAEGRVGSHHRRRGGCTPERGADATEAPSVKSAEPTVESTSASVESTSASVESTASVESPSTAKSCSSGRRERGGRQAERQGDDSNQIASHSTTFQYTCPAAAPRTVGPSRRCGSEQRLIHWFKNTHLRELPARSTAASDASCHCYEVKSLVAWL
jgi:hypothetical protein